MTCLFYKFLCVILLCNKDPQKEQPEHLKQSDMPFLSHEVGKFFDINSLQRALAKTIMYTCIATVQFFDVQGNGLRSTDITDACGHTNFSTTNTINF